MRILTVTGISRPARSPASFEARTTAPTRSENRSRFQGRAAPPPFFVTLGTGHPKFRSMWSVRSRSTSIVAAFAMTVRVDAVELQGAHALGGVGAHHLQGALILLRRGRGWSPSR